MVFHSLRHTSAGVKLKLSKGDLKAVQGDGGWNTPDMITKRYAHILDEDRRKLAQEMDASFYGNKSEEVPQAASTLNLQSILELFKSNPELIAQALQTVQLANKH